MGKNTLYTGIIAGAIIGGFLSLLDKETRQYAKGKYLVARSQMSGCLKHPSNSLNDARYYMNQFNDQFNENADQAINAIEQVEQTIDKFTKEKSI